ncbi:MAG: NAD(P)H-binding protein [Saonia sp.]
MELDKKTAIILGATGLTGGLLLQSLLKHDGYEEVRLFSRSSVGFKHPKLKEYLVDLMNFTSFQSDFRADEVFCCIGTTNAKNPDKERYRKIDYGIPVNAAGLCKANHMNTFIVISALGADPKSSIFYNRTKGEMEDAVLELQINKTHILQPSLIGGTRKEKRTGERLAKRAMGILNFILWGPLKKYRSIHPEAIAYAMLWLANNVYDKVKIKSDEIAAIAKDAETSLT